MFASRFLYMFVWLLVGGCAISPGPEVGSSPALPFCDIPRTVLTVDAGDGQPLVRSPFSNELQQLYSAPQTSALLGPPVSDSMLILSGGSQHGAFGAGVLSEWAAKRPGGLPRFRVVTAVSTGAIMATHAFLNRTEPILSSYRIEREDKILHPYVGSAENPGISDGIAIARNGALGNLAPMRALLDQAITNQMILDVAAEGKDSGRGLFFGAVDVDTGQAVIFNMTKLAWKFKEQVSQRPRLRDCYLDAIVASSSVPLAAPPTFIDNRMYIDGGARFGVLSDEIADAATSLVVPERAGSLSAASEEDRYPFVYVVINGDLSLTGQCGKVDSTKCTNGSDPGTMDGAHKDWKITSLASRSVDILIDQIYRFSNSRVQDRAKLGGFTVRMLRIHPDVMKFSTAIDHLGSDTKSRSCEDWRAEDQRLDQPIEFHPRYMHCLTYYGAKRVNEVDWSRLE